MKRMILFLLTNFSIMLVFWIIISITGIQKKNLASILITAISVGFGGAWTSLLLSKIIALRSVGGKIIHHPVNATEDWILKTVSQQAHKAGIKMPQVAIYQAASMNAFATGAHRNSSLIALSTGLLNNMKPDETEAVLAHEVSHIANGDMVTMSLLQGVLNTFVIGISRVIAQIFSELISFNSKEGKIQIFNSTIYNMTSSTLEMIFGLLASIISLYFSRQREFYADAGSAQIVGIEKMIAALKKLQKTIVEPQEPKNIIKFCINGRNKKFQSPINEIFRSHPTLEKRIEALRLKQYLK
ncbi:MAG: protease HtpX [Candidatus Dasytiphilus stammeri]